MICYDYPERPAEISRSVRDGAVTLQHRVTPCLLLPPLLFELKKRQTIKTGERTDEVALWSY
jgi:hypothetical protein